MLTIINNVLSPQEVVAAQRFMAKGDFNDGKLTAGKLIGMLNAWDVKPVCPSQNVDCFGVFLPRFKPV